jgi:hypothetical protein
VSAISSSSSATLATNPGLTANVASIVFSNVTTQTISISGITVGGADGGNYVVNVAGSQAIYSAAKITPKSVTVIGATGVTKTYDGTTQLPDSVIPTALLDYVKEKHPENFITDWELENKHQQIRLDNGLSLEFDLDGKFLRIDS